MQALFINTHEKCVTPVDLPTDTGSYHSEVNRLLQCLSHIYTVSTDKAFLLIVDEDCLVTESNGAFLSSFMKRPLFGNALIVGRDPHTGEKTDVPVASIPTISQVTFCSREETKRYRLEALEFATSLQNKRR